MCVSVLLALIASVLLQEINIVIVVNIMLVYENIEKIVENILVYKFRLFVANALVSFFPLPVLSHSLCYSVYHSVRVCMCRLILLNVIKLASVATI